MLDDFLGRFTSCFVNRSSNKSINDKIGNKDLTEDEYYESESYDSKLTDNSHLYNFPKIFQKISNRGISVFKVKSIFSINKVSDVYLRYNIQSNSFIIKNSISKLEKILAVKDLIDVIFGNNTSKFVIMSSKLDILPWRCFSLINKYYETYDFICENDEETFYLLILIKILFDSQKFNKLDNYIKGKINISGLVAKLYWEKAFLKFKYNKNK